jgi:hypothetical protein
LVGGPGPDQPCRFLFVSVHARPWQLRPSALGSLILSALVLLAWGSPSCVPDLVASCLAWELGGPRHARIHDLGQHTGTGARTVSQGAFAHLARRPGCALRVQTPVFASQGPPANQADAVCHAFSFMAPQKRSGSSFPAGTARWSAGGGLISPPVTSSFLLLPPLFCSSAATVAAPEAMHELEVGLSGTP